MIALGSITEGPDKNQFSELVMQAMLNLLNMFNEPSSKVREAITWVMSRICEHHADVLTNQNTIQHFIMATLNALKDKPRISNQCCLALEKLAVSTEPTSNL